MSIQYETNSITLAADSTEVIKSAPQNYMTLSICNNSSSVVTVLLDDDTTGINLTDQTLIFDNLDVPKNKISIKNIGTEEANVVVLWSI